MISRGITGVITCLLIGGALLGTHAQQPKDSLTDAAGGDFAALMQTVLDAWSTLDPANAARYYASEPDHVFFDFAPMEYDGWQAYAEGVKKAGTAYSSAKITLNPDVRVHKTAALVWATATWHMALERKEGTKEAMDGRWTVLWERRGDQWLIVHEHFSVPLH